MGETSPVERLFLRHRNRLPAVSAALSGRDDPGAADQPGIDVAAIPLTSKACWSAPHLRIHPKRKPAIVADDGFWFHTTMRGNLVVMDTNGQKTI